MSNGVAVCTICGGIGLVTKDVPVEHPDFGKAFPCVCQADKVKSRRAENLRKVSNLGAFADKIFSTFQIDYALLSEDQQYMREAFPDISDGRNLTEEQQRYVNIAAERAHRYAENPRGWLLFRGSYGTGKTHLAAAIANRRLELNEPVLFITAPDLLDYLRSTYGPTSEIGYDERFEQFRTATLLILDDLGAESQTPWALEKLYQLFSYRHTNRLPTVITTNKAPETFDPRIYSRIVDKSLTDSISLEIPDRRLPSTAWQELDLSNLDRYHAMTFSTFDSRQEEGLTADQLKRLERAVQIAHYYAESPRGWLFLMGEPGSGKTHLAAAIAHESKQQGQQVLFVTASELLDHLRVTFYPGSNVSYDKRLTELRQTSLLVLDSLIIDKSLSSWARDKLFDILIYRFDYDLPTVITTSQPLNEMDTRLKSRATNVSRSEIVAITAPSYPGKATRRRAAPPRMASRKTE